ncbi:hypothetical protein VNO80_00560 [Phaseolus coccineus]|uniref:Secreted protein n=1 Tax=Phaseolus coccineus TaxID=3886 RepID=A0AAN9P5H2_PHACN
MRPIHLWLSYIAFRHSVHSISISISSVTLCSLTHAFSLHCTALTPFMTATTPLSLHDTQSFSLSLFPDLPSKPIPHPPHYRLFPSRPPHMERRIRCNPRREGGV